MKTRAHIVFEVVADGGQVLFTTQVPLDDNSAAVLQAGAPSPRPVPLAPQPVAAGVSPTAPAPAGQTPAGDLTVTPPPISQQPVVEDLRLAPQDIADMAECGLHFAQPRSMAEFSPSPRPVIEQGIRAGGDPRQRLASGLAAPTAGAHRNGLADGQGNTIPQPAAPTGGNPAAPAAPPAKKKRRAPSAGETPLAHEGDGRGASEMA